MKKIRRRLSTKSFKRQMAAMFLLCSIGFTGIHAAAIETMTAQMNRTNIQVKDAGDVVADVVKEVLPHPLLPYQAYNIAVYNGVASPSDSFFMMGQEYFQGAAYSNYDGGRFVYYNLEQKCNHVSFLVGHIDDERSGEAVLYVYADGIQIQTIELTPDMITKEVVLDTTGVTQLVFQIEGMDSSYGLAQVHGRNAISWDEKFDWDVKYVDNITFLGDWKIIFGTVKIVLKRDGINSETSATMEEFMGTEAAAAQGSVKVSG